MDNSKCWIIDQQAILSQSIGQIRTQVASRTSHMCRKRGRSTCIPIGSLVGPALCWSPLFIFEQSFWAAHWQQGAWRWVPPIAATHVISSSRCHCDSSPQRKPFERRPQSFWHEEFDYTFALPFAWKLGLCEVFLFICEASQFCSVVIAHYVHIIQCLVHQQSFFFTEARALIYFLRKLFSVYGAVNHTIRPKVIIVWTT